MRQKGRKKTPWKIPLPGEIPAVQKAEIGLLPEVIPTVIILSGQPQVVDADPSQESFRELCN